MTSVTINAGICGLVTVATVTAIDDMQSTIQVKSACPSITKMINDLGTEYDPYEICLGKPGTGPFYEYAEENFPSHCGCIAIAGIIKAVEVENKLALPADASINFMKD